MKVKIICLSICVVTIFSYIVFNKYVDFSNSYEVISYNREYEIGNIIISSSNINRKIMQGLDNEYYYSHNYLNQDSEYGEFFLDTYGDLINNNNPIIYSNSNNLDISTIRINDIVNINYLNNDLCYRVVSVNRKLRYDLLIKLVSSNREYNIFLVKEECKI